MNKRHIRRWIDSLTLRDLASLSSLVVHRASSLLNEFVALNAKVDDFRSFNSELNQFFSRIVDNICSSLKRRVPAECLVTPIFCTKMMERRHYIPCI